MVIIQPGRFNHKRLYHRRHECGLTLETLGDMIGREASTVQTWETGKADPRAPALLALSRALKVEPVYFYQS